MSYVYCGWLDSALKWILNNIISPIFNCIKGVLSSVFSFIYGNVLGPILDKTIYAIGRKIWEMFLDMFFESMYSIAKMVLQILDCLSDLFDTLLGVQPVIFKGEETTLLRAFLSMDAVRRAFWYINFFALGLAVIFAVYGVTRSMLDFDFENKRPVSRVMSSLLSSVLNLFTVQFAVFGIIYLAEAILTGLNSAMALAGGAAGNTTLGRMIFVLGTLNAANDESFNLSSEAVQNGSKVIGPTDTIRKKFFESSGLNPFKLSDVKTCFNIHKLDYIILIGLGMVFSFLLLVALIAVVRRLFNLLLLYIVSPLFAATIPLDDGEHFGKWRNLFVGTCFTGYGMLVAMKLYLLICPTIMGSELKMSGSVELNFVCKVVFLLGGLWAVYKSSSMITSLISAEAGSAEAESVAAGTEIGKMIGGSLWTMIKSGKRPDKDKEGKEGQDGQNGKLGEGSQRFNGKNTGAAGTGDHGKDNAFQGDMRNRNDKLEGAGKKENKAKSSKTGKLGAENRTLDKLRKQFDMDNTDNLDKENKPAAEQSKNKNAFKGGKGKTTDSLGLGAGKNKKSMDALRSKLGFDAAPKAAEAGDVQTESELEKALNGQNKPGAGGAVKGKAGGQKGKLEGNKPTDKKAGGVAAAAKGGRRAQDDSGYTEQHSKLTGLLDKDEVGTGRFGGKNQGLDNGDLINKNRPTLNQVGGSWKDTQKTANKAASQTTRVQGGNPPVDTSVENDKNNVFTGTGNNPSKNAEPNLTQNPAENKVDMPKTGTTTNIPKVDTNKDIPKEGGLDVTAAVNGPKQDLNPNPTQVPNASQGFGQNSDQPTVQPDLHADGTSNKFGSMSSKIEGSGNGFGAGNPQMSNAKNPGETFQPGGVDVTNAVKGMEQNPPQVPNAEQGFVQKPDQPNVQPNPQVSETGNKFGSKSSKIEGSGNGFGAGNPQMSNVKNPGETFQPGGVEPTIQTQNTQTFGQGGMPAGGVSSQQQTLNPGQTGNQAYAPDKGVGSHQNNMQPDAANVGINPSPAHNDVGKGGNYQTDGVPNSTPQTFVQGQGVPGPQKFDQGQGVPAGDKTYINDQPVNNAQQSAMRGGMRHDDTDISYGEVNTNSFRRSAGIDPTFGAQSTVGSNNTYNASNVNLNQNLSNTSNMHASNRQQMDVNNNFVSSNENSNISMDQNVNVQNNSAGSDVYSNISNSSNTVNMNKNDIHTDNLGSSANHSNVADEEIQVGGRSYARDDSSFSYRSSEMNVYRKGKGFKSIDDTSNSYTTGNGGPTQYTYSQTIKTEVQSSVGFEKEHNTMEKEMNEVVTNTRKVHEQAQKDKNNDRKDDKK